MPTRFRGDGPILVRSEAEAWALLAECLRSDDGDLGTAIRFSGWPNLKVGLSTGNASLSPTFMRAFVDLQDAIWRSHALLNHGEANISYLSDEEKAQLQLEIFVKPGSSNFEAGVDRIATALAGAVSKMNSKQVTLLVLAGVLGFFADSSWKAHVNARVEEHRAALASQERIKGFDTQVALSQQESERMKMLEEAQRRASALQDVLLEAERAKTSFLKSAPPEAKLSLQGTTITGSLANEIAKTPRESARGDEIVSIFSVQQVDARDPVGFRVKLKDLVKGTGFSARLSEDISPGARRAVERATFEKSPIRATVEVHMRRGKIERARILSATAAPESAVAELTTRKRPRRPN